MRLALFTREARSCSGFRTPDATPTLELRASSARRVCGPAHNEKARSDSGPSSIYGQNLFLQGVPWPPTAIGAFPDKLLALVLAPLSPVIGGLAPS